MEEKVYDRQVAKQSLARRVLDEQQIERHFNAADLMELYSFSPDSKTNRPTPMVPKDRLLAEMLMRHKHWIVSYHEHDSLLQNVVEEDLTEEERKLAWEEFEEEGRRAASDAGASDLSFFADALSEHCTSESTLHEDSEDEGSFLETTS